MRIIGITGPSGGGKTTALRALRALGVRIIDCDAVYHELLRTSDGMLREIQDRFHGVVTDGVLDRKALGKIVFADADALSDLNKITHRYVDIEVSRLLDGWRREGAAAAAIDAIALVESGLSKRCDLVVCVTAPEEVRIRRIMARDRVSEDYARLRVGAQQKDSFYKAHCDHILVSDCGTSEEFEEKCRAFFARILGGNSMLERDDLFFTKKNAYDGLSDEEKAAIEEYCAGYKQFLDNAKTEREAVREAIRLAAPRGFVPYERGMALKPGLKIYKNIRDKALILAVIGRQPLSKGVTIAGAHTDSPRIDLKQLPLYEDSELAYLKTHYYGGIKKYQWMTIPLALHGVAVKKDGTVVDVVIGENENDPIFVITDLLPHLAKDQEKKTLGEAFTGENLNILIGSRPTGGEKDADRVKHAVLQLLYEKYGIVEEDFLSAELEAVPAAKARDVGFDRSLIGAYGQDDRSCVYAELKAILDIDTPEKTAVCILTDKEEIGSYGVSGSQSTVFETFMEDLCDSQGVKLRHCFENSFCLSADVCNAFDPNFPEVSEKRNAAKCNYGMAIMKYSGARGKSGSSDASAEVVAKLRKIFSECGVVWQMAELGKVDQGGGGTIAKDMAARDIDTIDAGVPVLSMHAPYEVTAKLDCYMAYKGIKAVYDEK